MKKKCSTSKTVQQSGTFTLKRYVVCFLLILSAFLLFSFLLSCSQIRTFFGHQESKDPFVYQSQGLSPSQLQNFRSSLKPINGEIKAKYDLARHFQKLNRHLNAIEELNEVVKMEPSFPEAYNALGVSYDSLGKFAMAEECYKMALRLNPDLSYVVNNLGYSYMMQGKFDDAVHFLEMAVSMEENNLKYRNNLLMASQRAGKTGQKPDQDIASDRIVPEETEEKIIEPEPFMIAPLESTSFAVAVDNEKTRNDPKEVNIFKTNVAENQDYNELAASESLKPETLKPETINSDTFQPSKIINKHDTGISLPAPVELQNSQKEDVLIMIAERSDENRSLEVTDVKDKRQTLKVSPAAVEIELVNGNGITGFAKKTGNYLREKGYRIRSLKNAEHFNHNETRIYFPENFNESAHLLAEQLPGGKVFSDISMIPHNYNYIRVLLGKDLVFTRHGVGQEYRPKYQIEISNGNGVNGAAKKMSVYLRNKGIQVNRLTNADHFNHPSSLIFYGKDQLSNAQALLESLPEGSEAELVDTNANGSQIKLLIGKNMR
jgi:hypothetical protein